MNSQLKTFVNQLGIDENYHFSFEMNDKDEVVELMLYDADYDDFPARGPELLDMVAEFKSLETFEISIGEYVIGDISALASLSNLKNLDLDCINEVIDLSPLAGLHQLEKLFIGSAQIRDLSPLSGLKKLKQLNFYRSNIEDIEVLANCTELEVLELGYNKIKDFSVLSACTALRFLSLPGNRITDISFLEKLTSIIHLNLNENLIEDAAVISGLKELNLLHLHKNQISSLDFIKDLKKIYHLIVDQNPIDDINPIAGLDKLTWLNADGITVSDVSIFKNFKDLRGLFLRDTGLTDISFLKDLTKINQLALGGNAVTDIAPLLRLKLSYLDLHNNKGDLSAQLYMIDTQDMGELDLRGNSIGDKRFVRYIQDNENDECATFASLEEELATYYFAHNMYDEALACSYIEKDSVIRAMIYTDKFIAQSVSGPEYYLRYYFAKSFTAYLNSRDEKIGTMDYLLEKIKEKCRTLNKSLRDEFLDSIEHAKHYSLDNHLAYWQYMSKHCTAAHNPEMLYFIGKSLKNRDNLLMYLSVYKELVLLNHPLQYRLYKDIRNCLRMNFAYTEDERAEHNKYENLLQNILGRDIPHFDYFKYAKTSFRIASYEKKLVTIVPKQQEVQQYPEDTFPGRILLTIVLILMIVLIIEYLHVIYPGK